MDYLKAFNTQIHKNFHFSESLFLYWSSLVTILNTIPSECYSLLLTSLYNTMRSKFTGPCTGSPTRLHSQDRIFPLNVVQLSITVHLLSCIHMLIFTMYTLQTSNTVLLSLLCQELIEGSISVLI